MRASVAALVTLPLTGLCACVMWRITWLLVWFVLTCASSSSSLSLSASATNAMGNSGYCRLSCFWFIALELCFRRRDHPGSPRWSPTRFSNGPPSTGGLHINATVTTTTKKHYASTVGHGVTDGVGGRTQVVCDGGQVLLGGSRHLPPPVQSTLRSLNASSEHDHGLSHRG